MGNLIYGGSSSVFVEDHLLAHAEALTRLFFSQRQTGVGVEVRPGFTLVIFNVDGSRSHSFYVSPHIPIEFVYENYETVKISRAELQRDYETVVYSGKWFMGDGLLPYELTD